MVCKVAVRTGLLPCQLNEDGTDTSCAASDSIHPSLFAENITDPNDPDYEIGFRALRILGFQRRQQPN